MAPMGVLDEEAALTGVLALTLAADESIVEERGRVDDCDLVALTETEAEAEAEVVGAADVLNTTEVVVAMGGEMGAEEVAGMLLLLALGVGATDEAEGVAGRAVVLGRAGVLGATMGAAAVTAKRGDRARTAPFTESVIWIAQLPGAICMTRRLGKDNI